MLPAPWDLSGNTSLWVLALVHAGQQPLSRTCTEQEHDLERAWWHSHVPEGHRHLDNSDSNHLKQLEQEGYHADGSQAPVSSDWFEFRKTNQTQQFTVQLVDPTGKVRCQKAFPMTWRKKEVCDTVKEEIFVGEKFRTFPFKTVRMEFNFVLSNWPKKGKARRHDRKACKPGGRKFCMEINFVLFSNIRKLRN